MRSLLPLALIVLAAQLLLPADAAARRGRARPAGPLATGVAPFEGERAGGTPIAEAVELELELVESVVVKGGRWMKRDLRMAGREAFTPGTLRKIMRKRKLDVLIRGRQVGDRLWVYAYASDGQARYAESFPLPDGVDARAREIVEDLGQSLDRWASLSPIRGDPADPRRPVVRGDEDRVSSDDDLFVDFDDEDDAPRRPVTPRDPDGRGERRVIGADPEPEEPPARRRVDDRGRDDRWDEREEDWGDARRSERRDDRREDRRDDRWDEGAARRDDRGGGRSRRRALGLDDDRDRGRDRDRLERPETTLDEVERGDAPASPLEKTHWLSVAAVGAGDFWFYDFTGNSAAQSVRVPGQGALSAFGGGARVALWPLRYVGVEGDALINYMKITVRQPAINPTDITTLAYTVGVTGKARYVHDLDFGAVGIGARLGYRFWGRGVDLQTSQDDNEPLTVVPGWQQHALALGVEGYGSLVAFERRFELEVRADALPLTNYAEKPDNPGATSQAIGWSANALVRIPIFHPVTLELGGYTLGSTITFDGLGDRLQREDGAPVKVQGGTTLNLHAGGTVGIGVVF